MRDSKDLKDPQIIAIAKDLMTFLPFSLLNVMPEKESISDPDLGGRFIFNLPYEKGDDSITFQLWHPYYVWEQSFSLEVSVS